MLTKLGFREYAITVNVEAVDVDELIEKEQKELNRVEGDYESLRKSEAPCGHADEGDEDRTLQQRRQLALSHPVYHPGVGQRTGTSCGRS